MRRTFYLIRKFTIATLMSLILVSQSYGARIKDIADFEGVRQNQLVGYGLVVGLDGTGDGKDAKFTIQSMASMLEKMGITVEIEEIDVDNVAAVMVTADLPAFSKVGSRIDVTVSSIGDAKNLQGGTLLLTPLRAVDGNVYAVAQGSVSTGGFSVGGASGGKVQKNFPTVGRVVSGALIEREISSLTKSFREKSKISLCLHRSDFTTAARVAKVVNSAFSDNVAMTLDAGTVEIRIQEKYLGNIVEYLTLIESLEVTPDTEAKVLINERTGTVVIGKEVKISTIAIAHGNLSIEVKETTDVSQPLPLSGGETVTSPETEISVKEEKNPLFLMNKGVDINDVVRALNALGVSPRDLIAIFQALKAAGALQAELEII
jgi:flagellar P-ring protein precursor FlgI